jgi:hypothetical protein
MNVAELTSLAAPEDNRARQQLAAFNDDDAISDFVSNFAKDVLQDEADNLLAFLKRLQRRVCLLCPVCSLVCCAVCTPYTTSLVTISGGHLP